MPEKKEGNRRLINILAAAGLALLTAVTWSGVLDYYFPSEDHLGFLPWVKVESLSDFKNIFILEGRPDQIQGVLALYRPIVTLTGSLDYFINGLNPTGYHITDLVLHWLCAILLFLLVQRLPTGNRMAALIAATLFILHPLHIETVPVSVRRAESVMGFFMLLSFILFIEHLTGSGNNKKGMMSGSYLLSVFFGLLSFATKETGLVLPGMIFLFTFLHSDGEKIGFRHRTVRALRYSVSFLLAGIAFFAVRWMVIGGMGGYASKLQLSFAKRIFMSAAVVCYIGSRMINPFFPTQPSPVDYAVMYAPYVVTGFVLLGGLSGYYLYCRRTAVKEALLQPMRMLENERLKDYLLISGCLLGLFTPYVVFALWMPWYSYVPVMFLCILCAMMLQDACRYLAKRPWTLFGAKYEVLFQTFLAVIMVVYFLVIIIFSPLFTRSYKDWQAATEINREILEKTEATIAGLPKGSHFYLVNYPIILGNHISDWNHVRTLALLADYTVEGYFKLKYPEKGFRFRKVNETILTEMPEHLEVSTEFQKAPYIINIAITKGGGLLLPRVETAAKTKERVSTEWFDVFVEEKSATSARGWEIPLRLRVEMKPEGLKHKNLYFLVFEGEKVTLQDPADLGWKESLTSN